MRWSVHNEGGTSWCLSVVGVSPCHHEKSTVKKEGAKAHSLFDGPAGPCPSLLQSTQNDFRAIENEGGEGGVDGAAEKMLRPGG